MEDWTLAYGGFELEEERIRIQDLQGKLYAENEHGLLIVLQAIATGGKDGVIKHVFNDVNPQGCRISSESVGKGLVPVEVEPFGWEATLDALASLGCDMRLRTEDSDPSRPFVTDGDHYTGDCLFDAIPEPNALQTKMKRIPGAIETGLFLGIARAAVVGHADSVQIFMI
jgi:hypothetical protein